jgi:single-strand DNA-binding protein
MADLNNFAFTGRLTKDAEYRTLASGKGVLTMSVAVNTGYGDYKKTTYIKAQLWGERGSKIAAYLLKGKLIATCGTLTTNEYDTKDGVHKTELVCDVQNIAFYDTQAKGALPAYADGAPADDDIIL